MEDEPLPSHVQWLLERRGPALSSALAREGEAGDARRALRVLMSCDPSPGKVATQWLCAAYLAGGFFWEDAAAGTGSKAAETLALFAAHRAKLPREGRNISAHAGLASLYKAVKPFLEAPREPGDEPSGKALRRAERERAIAESIVVHRGDDLIVAVPLTEAASRWWGKGTRWCTAADNDCAFREYDRAGPLVVMVLPGRHPDEPARKWQMHAGRRSAQLMDEEDERIKPELVEAEWDRVGGVLAWGARREGAMLIHVPMECRTPALCLEAVGLAGEVLDLVPAGFRTHEVCMAAVAMNGFALKHVPPGMQSPEICMAAVRQAGRALGHVQQRFITAELCLEAVRRDGGALRHVPEFLRTRAVCLEAVLRYGFALQEVPPELRTPEVCLAAVRRNGMALDYVPAEMRLPRMCREAVLSDGQALRLVPNRLRTRSLCFDAMRRESAHLYDVPVEFRDREMCLEAVRRNRWALDGVPTRLRTPEMCLEAVRRNGRSLSYVPVEAVSPELCREAVSQDGMALDVVPEHLRTPEVCLLAALRDGKALEFVPRNLLTLEMCVEAARRDPYALNFAPVEWLAQAGSACEEGQAARKPRLWGMEALDGLGEAIRAHAADFGNEPAAAMAFSA